MEYTEEQLKRLRDIELELYQELAGICRKHELTFVTGFGTTLGAIRHKGFIPWDDDMDFLMPRKDYEILIRVAPEELKGSRYALLEPRLTENYVMSFAKLCRKDTIFLEEVDKHVRYHNGICIDIFPMDYWPQNRKRRDHVALRGSALFRPMRTRSFPKHLQVQEERRPLLPAFAFMACCVFSVSQLRSCTTCT